MTNKEIADRLKSLPTSFGYPSLTEAIEELINELDPPRPEPGTVVWWQDIEGLSDPTLGQVNEYGRIEFFGTTRELEPHEVTWKTAHVLAPDDHGEQALPDALQDRIQTALEYIYVMWDHQPTDRSAYRVDLANLAAALEGNQEAEL